LVEKIAGNFIKTEEVLINSFRFLDFSGFLKDFSSGKWPEDPQQE